MRSEPAKIFTTNKLYEFRFNASRSDRNSSPDISNHVTIKTEGHEKVTGEIWRSWWSNGLYSSSSGEETTPLDDDTPLDDSQEFTTSSPGFDGRKSISGGMLSSTPGAGGGGPAGAYNGIGTGSPSSGSVADGVPDIGYGYPGFGNAGAPNAEEIAKASIAAAAPETASAPAAAPASSSGGILNSIGNLFNAFSDAINQKINAAFFDVKINTDNENYKQVHAQNQMANEVLGEHMRPDRGAYEAAKGFAGMMPGASFIVNMEEATNTDNSICVRLLAAGGAAMDMAGILGAAKAIENRMCGLVSCFTEGTQVVVGAEYTEDDVFVQYVTVNIEDINVGDLVYSYDTITGEATRCAVTQISVLESDHIDYLTVVDEQGRDQTIETTDAHPFWVVTDNPDLSRAARSVVDENGNILYHENIGPGLNGFWVEAKDLQEGDVFLGVNGELSTLVSKDRVEFPDGIKVYNFTVEGNHDYFVIAKTDEYGQTSILVHNAKDCHGNSKLSKVPAILYKMVDQAGEFLKWGVSQNPDKRYTKKFLESQNKAKLDPIETGLRADMLAKERSFTETSPGPLNHEPWAGKAREALNE